MYVDNNYIQKYYGISIFLPDQTWWTLKDKQGNSYRDYFVNVYKYLDLSVDIEWYNFISQLYDVR